MISDQSPVRLAADAVGGIPNLADALGISRHAIYQWDRIPAERVIRIEEVTGVPRERLRPDLYGGREAPELKAKMSEGSASEVNPSIGSV